MLQTEVWAFAYPFGGPDINDQILKMPQRAGFEAAFLNFGAGMATNLPAYTLPRIHISAEMNLAEFEAHLSGVHGRLQQWWRPQCQEPGNEAAAILQMTNVNATDPTLIGSSSHPKPAELNPMRS
jgi:hypothetical protein